MWRLRTATWKLQKSVAAEAANISAKDMTLAVGLDITLRTSIADAFRSVIAEFGGIDGIVNTAAIFGTPDRNGRLPDDALEYYLQRQHQRQLLSSRRIPRDS